MEERIKGEMFNYWIYTLYILFFVGFAIAGFIEHKSEKILDRIEQLEAQVDRIERTNN